MLRIAWFVLILLATGTDTAGAAILRVPSEYPTINDALDASLSGDTVLVAPGTYSQYDTRLESNGLGFVSSVAFLKGGVVLRSEAGAAVTTLTMTSTTSAPQIAWYDVAAGPVEVVGFTFTGDLESIFAVSIVSADKVTVRECIFENIGDGTSNQRAIAVTATDADVFDCTFRDITGGGSAAIVVSEGQLVVEDSLFENVRDGVLAVDPNPIHERDKALTLRRCTFRDNEHTGSGNVSAGQCSSVLVEDCRFEFNRGISSSGGAVFATVRNGEIDVRGCVFRGNFVTETSTGGAISLFGRLQSTVTLMNCSFYGNSQEGPFGGSAARVEGTTVYMYNNIFSNSTGGTAVRGEGYPFNRGCNVYWDNPDGHVEGFTIDSTSVIADPLFCDPENGEFSVDALSPCLPQNSGACGLIGAYGQGCGAVSVDRRSWGRLKADFRSENPGEEE